MTASLQTGQMYDHPALAGIDLLQGSPVKARTLPSKGADMRPDPLVVSKVIALSDRWILYCC